MSVATDGVKALHLVESWYIRPKEAARLVGVSRSEIYRAIYRGELPALQFKTRVWLIRTDDLEQWLHDNAQPSVA